MQHCEFAALGSACEALRLLGSVDRRYATPVSPSRIAPLRSRPRGAEASWTRSEGHPLLRLGGATRGLQPHARPAQGQEIDRSNDGPCPRHRRGGGCRGVKRSRRLGYPKPGEGPTHLRPAEIRASTSSTACHSNAAFRARGERFVRALNLTLASGPTKQRQVALAPVSDEANHEADYDRRRYKQHRPPDE
jgi:hypothetical protein